MKMLNVRIISNENVKGPFYRMRLGSSYLADSAKPGQFVEIRPSKGLDPFLRRPLGVHRITDKGIEVLYEVFGKGTALLSGLKAGSMLDMIGPLGNGFRVEDEAGLNILVAGGIGVAPLLSLAEGLCKNSKRGRTVNRGLNTEVIIGARSASHILCVDEFKSLGCRVSVTTDDGSRGSRGFVTDVLKDAVSKKHPGRISIYACGPMGMLKAVHTIAFRYNISCQVSLEEHMACGVGVCLGCPVRTNPEGEYKMVCKDGPVFDSEVIAW